MIPIEKKIPCPAHKPGMKKYPWAEMKVGDSFLSAVTNVNNLYASRMFAQRKTGFEFTCRTTPDGVRVWRVK